MRATNFNTITPRMRPIPPSYRIWRLLDPIVYDVGTIGSGDRITVPKGFETDLASIPRIFWSILPPAGQYAPAAIVHDYIYVYQTRTRAEADKIFREAMKQLGVPWHRRNLMYSAVRVGGWRPWRKRKKALESGNV